MNLLKTVGQNYCKGVIRLIENNKRTDMPIIIQKGLIAIYFIQISGYLLTLSASNNLVEPKISSITDMVEISSGTYLLYILGNDTLTWIVFTFMNTFQIICFFFTLIIGSVHQSNKFINSSAIQYLSSIFNTYLMSYNWIFLISFIEINVGIIVCGKQCYIVSQRGSCSPKPLWQLMIGLIGLSLALITSFCVIYFFRNYEFHERIKLKRRFNIIQILQVGIRFLLVFCYYFQDSDSDQSTQGYQTAATFPDIFQFSIACSFSLLSLIDIIHNMPFLNDEISRFFILCLSIYTSLNISYSGWQIFLFLQQSELFFIFCILSLVLICTLMSLYQYKYETLLKNMVITTAKKSLKVHGKEIINSYLHNFDFFIEEFMRLCEESKHNENCKYRVMEFIRQHTEICEHLECYCKQPYFQSFISRNSYLFTIKSKSKSTEIDSNQLAKFTESIFRTFIYTNKDISQNLREHFSLKYIFFVTKYLKNPKKSFYELKFILNSSRKSINDGTSKMKYSNSNASFYFLLIDVILSINILSMVRNQFDDIKIINNYSKSESQTLQTKGNSLQKQSLGSNFNIHLEVKVLQSIDQITSRILPRLLEVVQKKVRFWKSFTEKGFAELSELKSQLLLTSKFIKQQTKEIEKCLQLLSGDIIWTQSIIFLRIMQLIDIFLKNDVIIAQKRQKIILDIQNREQLKEGELLEDKNQSTLLIQSSNQKQIAGDLICVVSSVSKANQGTIIGNTAQIAKFFGLINKQDISLLKNIKQILPDFIAQHHDVFVDAFLEYEETYSTFTKQQINKANLRPGGQAIQGKLKTFVKNQKGFIFPVMLQVDLPLIGVTNEFLFATSILKLPSNQEYILFNKSGNILGITEKVMQLIFREAKRVPNIGQVMQEINVHTIFYDVMNVLKEKRELIKQFMESPVEQFLNRNDLNDNESIGEIILEEKKRSSIELHSDPLQLNKQVDSYIQRQINQNKQLKSRSNAQQEQEDSSQAEYNTERDKQFISQHNTNMNTDRSQFYNQFQKQSPIQYNFLDEQYDAPLTEFFLQKRMKSYQTLKSRNQNSLKFDHQTSKAYSQVSVAKSVNLESKYMRFTYTLYQCSFPIYLNQLNSKANTQTNQEFKDSIYFKLAISDIEISQKSHQFDNNSYNTLCKSFNTQNFNRNGSSDYTKSGMHSFKTVKSFGNKNKSKYLNKVFKQSVSTFSDYQNLGLEKQQVSFSELSIQNPIQPNTPISTRYSKSPVKNLSKIALQRNSVIIENRTLYSQQTSGLERNENTSVLRMNSSIIQTPINQINQEKMQFDYQQNNLFPSESEPKTYSDHSKFNNEKHQVFQKLQDSIHFNSNEYENLSQQNINQFTNFHPKRVINSIFLENDKPFLIESEIIITQKETELKQMKLQSQQSDLLFSHTEIGNISIVYVFQFIVSFKVISLPNNFFNTISLLEYRLNVSKEDDKK